MKNDAVDRARWQRAQQLFAQRRWSEAKAEIEAIEGALSKDSAVWMLKSYIESYLGHYRSARSATMAASTSAVATAETMMDVVTRLRTFNEGQEIDRYVTRLGGPRRLSIPMLLRSAAQFSYLNLQDKAMQLMREAERGDPDYPPTLLSMAQVHIYQGDMEAALAKIARVERRAPGIVEIYRLLAQVGKRFRRSSDLEKTQRLWAGSASSPVDRMHLGFALHAMLDEAGEHAKAASVLDEAIKLKRSSLTYSSTENAALLDLLAETNATCASHAAHVESGAEIPVFIVGMHRSGTTLLEQILSGHDDVHGAGELYDFTSAMRYATDHHCQGVIDRTIIERAKDVDFAEVGQRYLDGLAWRLKGERFVTDKLPSNFFNIGFICKGLPQARILHMVRDPIEVCFSNLRELFSSANPYSYDQIELADFYLQYQRLTAHWHRVFPGRILDVHYNRLVSEPEVAVREVCAFVGLDYRSDMLDIGNRKRAVATASAVQVRSGITKRDVPKWKPYEVYLQPMINRLREGGALEGWNV